MNQWQPSAIRHLEQQNYHEVVRIYEGIIENNPDEINNYWYLGLAYLLQGEEEQAQVSWFVAFEQIAEEDLDAQTQILIEILCQEAERQLTTDNNKLAWLIRSHIRELVPDNFANFLELICLDIYINKSDIEQFETWKLGECCQLVSANSLPTELLLKTLHIILCLPCPDSLAFARFCLGKNQDFQFILAGVVNLAVKMAYDHRYAGYAADLIRICLEFEPSNLILLNALYVFYGDSQDYENALEIAYKFRENSPTVAQQIFSGYQIINISLKCHQWQELSSLFQRQNELIRQYVNNPEDIPIDFIRQSLLIVNQPSFYIQDSPQQNRHFINQIGQIFQSLFRKESKVEVKPYGNALTWDRPLKIGYIGSTFRSHSVGWLCRWLIHYQDQEKFPCYIYSITNHCDQITEQWFKGKAKGFYTCNRNVGNAIEQIQQDEIDILVDLDSLTLDLACQILALKPVPIQVTWLGLDAPGIPAMDYFLADPYVLPENAQDYYSEKIWRLPQTYLGIDGFEVGVPTLTREDLDIDQDAIIFFNVQNRQKLHPDTIRLQMRILREVSNSYLLIKERDNKKTAHKFFEYLAQEEGIELNRLRFLEGSKTELEHRANLSIADVMLDTYPYNGATTTLETLWMEIPLVTRVGEQFAARNSYTFMINAGITEGIAWSDEEYIEWGIKLGTDEDLRNEISWKLRQSKKTSPLWNGKQFTREMEKAYQQMWEIYLQNKN